MKVIIHNEGGSVSLSAKRSDFVAALKAAYTKVRLFPVGALRRTAGLAEFGKPADPKPP